MDATQARQVLLNPHGLFYEDRFVDFRKQPRTTLAGVIFQGSDSELTSQACRVQPWIPLPVRAVALLGHALNSHPMGSMGCMVPSLAPACLTANWDSGQSQFSVILLQGTMQVRNSRPYMRDCTAYATCLP
jgi:hypothetical protein